MNRKKELLFGFLTGMIALLITLVIYHAWNLDMYVPIGGYDSDIIGMIACIRDILNGDWVYYSQATFPYETAHIGGVVGHAFYACFFKLISLFVKDAVVICNVFYLMMFQLTGMLAYWSLRLFKVSGKTSFICAVLYTQLPYHYLRNEIHVTLSAYMLIPLACVCLYYVFGGILFEGGDNGAVTFRQLNKKKLLSGIAFCFLLGVSDIYYSALFAISCGVISVIAWVRKHDYHYFIAGFIFVVGIAVSLALVMLPSKLYGMQNDIVGYGTYRSAYEAELYGLKWIFLLLPIQGHRIPFLAKLRHTFDTSLFYNNENTLVSLGLFLSVGFVVSVLAIFAEKKCKSELGVRLKELGLLNIILVMIGTVGGVGSIVAVVLTPSIRCYNRICLFIAFFSAVALALLLDRLFSWMAQQKASKWVCYGGAVVLLLVGVLEMTSAEYADGRGVYFDKFEFPSNVAEVTEKIYNDREYVKQIEEIMPDNSNILQLPVVTDALFPNGDVQVWRHQWKQIFSHNLKWSYGDNSVGKTYLWLQRVKNLPTEQLLEAAAFVGFNGIYVDSIGYEAGQWEALVQEIEELTHVKPLINQTNEIYFYNISEYANNLKAGLSAEQVEERRRYWLENFCGLYKGEALFFTKNTEHLEDGACRMELGTIQYGPYCALDSGIYEVTYTGENLCQADFSAGYSRGEKALKMKEVKKTPNEVVYRIEVLKKIGDVEILCEAKEDGIIIDTLRIEKVE